MLQIKRQLRLSELGIKQIARELGFKDVSFFAATSKLMQVLLRYNFVRRFLSLNPFPIDLNNEYLLKTFLEVIGRCGTSYLV